jgi:hypothetical protein
MPHVSTAISRPPYATSEEYCRIAKTKTTTTTHKDPHTDRVHPSCVSLSVPKTHVLSPLQNSTAATLNCRSTNSEKLSIKDRLNATKEAYKKKLTLVKAKLKQRRHFRRSHQRYVVPAQPPSSAESRMAVPPAPPPPRPPLPVQVVQKSLSSSAVNDVLLLEKATVKYPTLKRRSSAPSKLSLRRGFSPPSLNVDRYPFGKHANDIRKAEKP